MLKKRGQVVLFIIVGIILLIGISFFFYWRTTIIPEPEIIPTEFSPIKLYIETCTTDIAKNALQILGQQGGYINLPTDIIRDESAYISLIPNGLVRTPLWYHEGRSFIPSLRTMEKQISDYIKEHLQECVDLSVFVHEFDIEETGDIEVETSIAENDINIRLSYPLNIKTLGQEEFTRISKFSTFVDVKLKKAWELGRSIVETENSDMFLENITIDLMAMNPEIPFTGLTFHCSRLIWNLEDIKEEIQSVLYWHISRLRVKNTDYPAFLADEDVYESYRKYTLEKVSEGNFPDEPRISKTPPEPAPEDAYEYFHYFIDTKMPETNLIVGFSYMPDWGMDITARPSQNDLLKSNTEEGQEYLSFLCINMWHFTYDLTYNVMVEVRDDQALGGEGFVLSFGIPVLIRHNQGNRIDFGKTLFTSLEQFMPRCEDKTEEIYDIRAMGTDEYGITNVDLKEVNITYDCIKFSCYLGETKADAGVYRLRTGLPTQCAHGWIIAKKPGYLKGKVQVLDDLDVDVAMRKLKTFNLKVVKHKYRDNIIEDEEELTENMKAFIFFQNWDDEDFVQYKQYPYDADALEEEKRIQVIDQTSKYYVDIFLYDEVDELLIGGYRGNWSVDYYDIAGNDLVFKVVEKIPKPMTDEEQANLVDLLDTNEFYKTMIKPEFR